MAEIVALPASIIQIASVGLAVAKGLYSIADGIGSAGREVRAYADEINGFTELLHRVRFEVLQTPGICHHEQSLLKDVLDICDRVLKPFNQLQDILTPLLIHYGDSPGRLKQLGLRIYWVFSCKKELLFYRDLLKVQHGMLDTIMATIMLRLTRHKTPQSIHILQIYLKGSVTAVEDSLNPNRDIHRRALDLNSASSPGPLFKEIENTSDELVLAQPSLHDYGQNDGKEIRSERPIGGGQLAVSRDDRITADDELSIQQVQDLDQRIQQSLDPDSGVSAQETLEDTRVLSRKIFRHARGVLETSSTATESPEDPKMLDFEEGPGLEDDPISDEDDRTKEPFTRDTKSKHIEYSNRFGDSVRVPYVYVDSPQGMHDIVSTILDKRLENTAAPNEASPHEGQTNEIPQIRLDSQEVPSQGPKMDEQPHLKGGTMKQLRKLWLSLRGR